MLRRCRRKLVERLSWSLRNPLPNHFQNPEGLFGPDFGRLYCDGGKDVGTPEKTVFLRLGFRGLFNISSPVCRRWCNVGWGEIVNTSKVPKWNLSLQVLQLTDKGFAHSRSTNKCQLSYWQPCSHKTFVVAPLSPEKCDSSLECINGICQCSNAAESYDQSQKWCLSRLQWDILHR